MSNPTTLSDKAVAVFAFAAFHQLSSGEKVADVVLRDGSGHMADAAAIEELQSCGLVRIEADRAAFTDDGTARLERMIQALRTAQ